jgi:hypothetical protein
LAENIFRVWCGDGYTRLRRRRKHDERKSGKDDGGENAEEELGLQTQEWIEVKGMDLEREAANSRSREENTTKRKTRGLQDNKEK